MDLIDIDALDAGMQRWHRDHWQPLERGLVDAATALGRALSVELAAWKADVLAGVLGPDLDKYRVALALPRLHLRQVLTQGLIPYTPETR